jgi:hypothetical protein
MAFRRHLALPPGHRLFSSSAKALAPAAIRASNLEWMLLAKDSPELMEESQFYLTTVMLDDNGEEILVLGAHLCEPDTIGTR